MSTANEVGANEPVSLGFSFSFNQFRDILYKYPDFLIQDMAPLKRQVMRINKLRKVSNHINANHFYANALMMKR